MSEDLTGRRLGHYKIDGVLGRGGMSVLYRATDVRLGRKVALKVMGGHITDDAEFRERFVDEARNTSAVDHPNVVPLYDFGEVDGMLYIAMRLVDGSDLATLVADGPISARRAVDLLDQVAGALDVLHEQGLVHLDLKPANVLVTSREAANEHVYLADFGLTRRGATGHRTSSGDFLGSPNYAAPEHLRGEPVDGRTDLYALTCMLFTCLTGRPPFQGQVPEAIQQHLRAEPPAVTSLVVLPPGIDGVLRRGMAKTPAGRPSTCKELIAAARAALAPAAGDAASPRMRPGPVSPPSGPQPAQGPPGAPPPVAAPRPAPVQPPPPPQVPPQFGRAPATPGPPQAPEQQGLPQAGAPGGDPVRLRPPMPAQPSSLGKKPGSAAKWVVPVLVVVAAAVIALLFVGMTNS